MARCCFAVYAATLGLHASAASRYGGDEPHYLLAARVDRRRRRRRPRQPVRAARVRASSTRPAAARTAHADQRAPARAAGRRLRAADRAGLRARRARPASSSCWPRWPRSAFVLAAPLARRLVPEPWASGGGAARRALAAGAGATATAVDRRGRGRHGAGRRPPCSRCGCATRPAAAAPSGCGAAARAAAVAGAAVPGRRRSPIAVALVPLDARRQRRGWSALVGGWRSCSASLVRLRDAQRPPVRRADPVRRASRRAADRRVRRRRLRRTAPAGWSALWIDRDYGLLRWAPVLALAFVAAWLLWRSRRDRVARVVTEQRDVEAAAAAARASWARPR